MNRPELYKKTVDILYQAYFKDTLRHANCQACAVGNIICANLGALPNIKEPGSVNYKASDGIVYGIRWSNYGSHTRNPQLDVTAVTGYSHKEIVKIELAFECVSHGKCAEDYMFNGLVAVLDVLKQIHEVTDEDQINNDRFTEHYQTRLSVK
jgi:hypothetical protein